VDRRLFFTRTLRPMSRPWLRTKEAPAE
jgi:hypothetical protein